MMPQVLSFEYLKEVLAKVKGEPPLPSQVCSEFYMLDCAFNVEHTSVL